MLSANVKIFKVQGETLDKHAKKVIIWGNHSSTQYPDVAHSELQLPSGSKSAAQAINDETWINEAFLKKIQSRGAAVIAARTMSSAMSAAKAAGDHMRDWWFGPEPNQMVSMGVVSDGSYGIPKDIVYSFPVKIQNKTYKIVQVITILLLRARQVLEFTIFKFQGLTISEFARQKMYETAKELEEERAEANSILQQ